MTRTIARTLLAAAVAASLQPPCAQAQPMVTQGHRPVMLIAADDLDPCSLGQIGETAPEEAVLVFPGDSTDLDPIGTLEGGRMVWVCETSEDGAMTGIVYSGDASADCELSSPVDKERPYLGPCDWGWIRTGLVEIVAG